MRTCARCGHQNPASASACESCKGLLTLQLHGGGFAPVENPGTVPDMSDDELSMTPGRATISTLPSISLKTEEYTPEELSFAESLSADELFSDSLDDKPGLAIGGEGVGFSLAGASFHDAQPMEIYEQLQAHTLRDPLIGQQVGNFRFVEKIGKGGFGAVYRAEQVYLGEPAAIKVLHLHQVDNPETVRRFQREARALAQLRHPSIVKMIDFGMLPQFGFYLVMELLEGDNLYSRLRARERFSVGRLKDIYRQLCDVLSFVHKQGIVHRDLKLSNIFLAPTEGGEEKLTLLDFGIAAIAGDIDQITKTGAYIGTATYASPEQIQGAKALDGRSDLYSLGVLLFRLLVGKPPFEGRNAMDITHRKLATVAPSLAALAPDRTWAPSLEAMMASVLERNPDKRPQDARAFWELCDTALTEQAALWRSYTQIDEVAAPDKAASVAAEGVGESQVQEEDVRERQGAPIRIERQSEAAISLRADAGTAALLNAHTLEVEDDDLPNSPKPLTPPPQNATQDWALSEEQRSALKRADQERAAQEQDSTSPNERPDSPYNIDDDELARTDISIDPSMIDLGATLDEAAHAHDIGDLDEDNSFATIKQVGLRSEPLSPGAMTVETPPLDMSLLGQDEAPKGTPKSASAQGKAEKSHTLDDSDDAELSIELESNLEIDAADTVVPSNEDALVLDAATRPMRVATEEGRDTLVNPLSINDMPLVAEAIAAESAAEASDDTEEQAPNPNRLGPKTIRSPHSPSKEDEDTPVKTGKGWGWLFVGAGVVLLGLLLFWWSR